jgi:hypothetical protein
VLIAFASFAAIAGVLIAGVLIGVAHFRRPELPAIEIPLSAYFTYPTRAFMTGAYASIAVALVSTAVVLMADSKVVDVVTALACCAGAVLLGPVAATTQRSATAIRSEATRRVHRYVAVSTFLAVGVAMAVSAYAAIVRANVFIAFPGVLGAILVSIVLCSRPSPVYGLRQKLVLGVLGIWILVIVTTE